MNAQNRSPEHSDEEEAGAGQPSPRGTPAPSYDISEVIIPGSQETVEKGFSLPDPRPPDESTLGQVDVKMNRVGKDIETLKARYERATRSKDKALAAANLQAKLDEWERLHQKTQALKLNLGQQ
jgi:hypothetical protein